MNKHFKLGDKVVVLVDLSEKRSDGIHRISNGTIAYVCDNEDSRYITVDYVNDKNKQDYFDLKNDQVKLLEKSNIK